MGSPDLGQESSSFPPAQRCMKRADKRAVFIQLLTRDICLHNIRLAKEESYSYYSVQEEIHGIALKRFCSYE